MKVAGHKTFPACELCSGTADPSAMHFYICPECRDTGSRQVVIGMRTGRDIHLTGNWPRALPAWRNPDLTPRYNAFVLLPEGAPDGFGYRSWRLACVIDRPMVKRDRYVGSPKRRGVDGHGKAVTSALVADEVSVAGRVEALNHFDTDEIHADDRQPFDAVVQVNDHESWPVLLKSRWVTRKGRPKGHYVLRSQGYVLDKRAMRGG